MGMNPRAGWPGVYQMRRKCGFSWPRTSKYLQPSNVFIFKCIFDLSIEPVTTDKVLSSCSMQVFWHVELFGFKWHASVFYRTSFRGERVDTIKMLIWSFMSVNAQGHATMARLPIHTRHCGPPSRESNLNLFIVANLKKGPSSYQSFQLSIYLNLKGNWKDDAKI